LRAMNSSWLGLKDLASSWVIRPWDSQLCTSLAPACTGNNREGSRG
jgi:hypothetical protein